MITRILRLIGRGVPPVALAVCLSACGGGTTTPTAASPPPPAPTYALSGLVTDSATSAGISGATVSITDGPNAGKSATAGATGSYTIAGLQPGGFTASAAAGPYVPSGQGVTLASNQTLNFALARQSLEGSWTGTTATQPGSPVASAARAITFRVNGANALTALTLFFQIVPASGSACQAYQATVVGTGTPPLAVENGGFTFASASNLVRSVTGTFGTGATASGTATIQWPGQSFEPAGCRGTINLTWTATKQ